jgi:hypothetical protein
MSTGFGSVPTDIQLNTYTSGFAGSVNSGALVNLSAFQAAAQPILIAFINVSNAFAATWMDKLPLIKAAVTCNVYVVICKHDGTNYLQPNNLVDVKPFVFAHGGHAAFSTIPVVIDPDGTTSDAYRIGLTGIPAVRDIWNYLVEGAYLISDKWHTATIAPGAAVSFKHIRLDPSPGDFRGDNVDIAQAYVQARINNLNAHLTIMDSDPINGTVIDQPSDIKRVFFSRPLAAIGTGADYVLSGGGVVAPPLSPPLPAQSPDDPAENGVTLGFPAAGLQDSGVDDTVTLTLTKANIRDNEAATNTLQDPNTLSFRADLTLPVLAVEALLVDGTGPDARSTLLKHDGTKPLVMQATRFLRVRILSDNPGSTLPSGRLVDVASTATTELSFNGLIAAELDNTVIAGPGTYELHIDDYTNKTGTLLPAAIFQFVVYSDASYLSYPGALEGWGYFPREEGLPAACPEAGALTAPDGTGTVPGWVNSGAATITPTPGGGNPLVIATGGTANVRWFGRQYGYSLKNGTTAAVVAWDAPAYVEAAFFATGATGLLANGFNGTADPTAPVPVAGMRTTGTGLRLRNGPYRCELVLVELAGADRRLGLRIHHPDQDARAYVLSAANDWTALHTYKLARAVVGGDPGYSLFVDGAAVAAVSVKEKYLPLVLSDEGAVDAEAAFGIFEPEIKTITASFEFIRYAFYDSKYAIGASAPANALTVGFPDIFRTAAEKTAGPFFRSTDITIDGSSGSDPSFTSDTPSMNIAATVTLAAAGAIVGKSVPAKLRFCYADFDDNPVTLITGFTNPGTFPVYDGTKIRPLAGSGVSTRALSITAAVAPTTAPSGAPFNWTVTVDRARPGRRLFILAYADSPLLDTPKLISGKGGGDYFARDAAGDRGPDPRGVIRQFLPDFYVRDNDTDDGTSTAGGSLSPDIGLAIFQADLDGLGNPIIPEPQSTTQALYPIGFAKGQPAVYGYTPSGFIPIDSTNPAKPIKLTDSGWSDYDGTTPTYYYNRIWVRISNRGIVPGPLKVQVFFLGSVLRAAFDPSMARASEYERIYARYAAADYVQSMFQLYGPSSLLTPLAEAIPALSGASNPAAAKSYAIAEFVWHVSASAVPPSTNDSHGCRAACVNLSEQAAWNSGVDSAPLVNTASSIWAANMATNNIAVRNSNIVQGQAPAAGDPVTKALIRNNSPVTYKKLPNDFRPIFSKRPVVWGIGLDARGFPEGDVILRVASAIAADARPKQMEEILPEDALQKRPAAPRAPGAGEIRGPAGGVPEKRPVPVSPYRFFLLRGGTRGSLEGIARFLRDQKGPALPDVPASSVSVFFQPSRKAREGAYEITVTQTANNTEVGGYRTTIVIPRPGSLRFVADERTGIIYNLQRNGEAIMAIPYENRAVFTGPGLAVQEGFRFGPVDAVDFVTGKLANELANFPRRFAYPRAPEKITALPGGLEGAVVGRVVDRKGDGVQGVAAILLDAERKGELGRGVTDENGRYLIRVKTEEKTVSARRAARQIELAIVSPEHRGELFRVRMKVADLCFAAKEITLK